MPLLTALASNVMKFVVAKPAFGSSVLKNATQVDVAVVEQPSLEGCLASNEKYSGGAYIRSADCFFLENGALHPVEWCRLIEMAFVGYAGSAAVVVTIRVNVLISLASLALSQSDHRECRSAIWRRERPVPKLGVTVRRIAGVAVKDGTEDPPAVAYESKRVQSHRCHAAAHAVISLARARLHKSGN